jgi:nitrogen regulatory protein P-II 1
MIRFTCYIRPHYLDTVKSAIGALGIGGISVSDVRGSGNSPEKVEWLPDDQGQIALPIRCRLEVVAPESVSESLIEAISNVARTGEHGDGKIFIERVEDAIRIRTEERGEAAI